MVRSTGSVLPAAERAVLGSAGLEGANALVWAARARTAAEIFMAARVCVRLVLSKAFKRRDVEPEERGRLCSVLGKKRDKRMTLVARSPIAVFWQNFRYAH